jgi:nitroimidazol reductase NimA-like FMN-containing flavoprotein (pyridoxamine 5'-phosphate oxidase superfamily)
MAAAGSDGHTLQTPRSTVRRKKERGSYEREAIDRILAEGLICHIGFVVDDRPVVLPTAYGRGDDILYFHGAAANAMFRALAQGAPACVTVTLVDGLVLSRAAFHHSMNYRSVVLFGEASRVDDEDEKRSAVDAVLEHIVPGRGADARPPTAEELRATLVVRFPISEGSAKVRTGGPIEDESDLGLPIWAGEIPFETVARTPVDDGRLAPGVTVPDYANSYARPVTA